MADPIATAPGSDTPRSRVSFNDKPVARFTIGALEQIVGRERRERELIEDFQLPIVDLIRAAASTQTLRGFALSTLEEEENKSCSLN